MKGVKNKYESKRCCTCKEVKVIHSFAVVCKECKKKERSKKYFNDEFRFNRQPIVAVKPTSKILVKASSNKELISKLLEEYDIVLKPSSIAKCAIKEYQNINYWYYRGMIIMLEKDYSPRNVNKVFLGRLKVRKTHTKHNRPVSDEMREKITQILTLRKVNKLPEKEIAKIVGLSRGMVTKILTGRSYGHITGITYERAYNKYGEDGDVLEPKERKSTKVYTFKEVDSSEEISDIPKEDNNRGIIDKVIKWFK